MQILGVLALTVIIGVSCFLLGESVNEKEPETIIINCDIGRRGRLMKMKDILCAYRKDELNPFTALRDLWEVVSNEEGE